MPNVQVTLGQYLHIANWSYDNILTVNQTDFEKQLITSGYM